MTAAEVILLYASGIGGFMVGALLSGGLFIAVVAAIEVSTGKTYDDEDAGITLLVLGLLGGVAGTVLTASLAML